MKKFTVTLIDEVNNAIVTIEVEAINEGHARHLATLQSNGTMKISFVREMEKPYNAEKIEALNAFLIDEENFTQEDLADVKYYPEYDYFEIGNREYKILTDEEADDTAKEYIEDTLWAFEVGFIIDHCEAFAHLTGKECDTIGEALREVQGKLYESANPLIKALISDFDGFVSDAITCDGRGHFISPYNGEEYEAGNYFIYRIN